MSSGNSDVNRNTNSQANGNSVRCVWGDYEPLEPVLTITDDLVLHLDASAIEGFGNGDPIEQWDDLSGEDNHLTQTNSSRRPTFSDGRVLFDGDNDFLTTSLFLGNPFNAVTLFLVGDFVGGTNDGWGYGVIQTESNGNVGSASLFNGITGTHGDEGSINITLDGNWSAGEISIYPNSGDARIQTLVYGSSNYRAYVDGNEELNISSSASVSATGHTFNIGGHDNQTRSIDGYIFEVLVYERALTILEIETVEQYLGEKWLDW